MLFELTEQIIFTTVQRHLLTQNAKALYDGPATFERDDGKPMCAYRSTDGNEFKCAAGCLIPDDAYDPQFETTSIEIILETHRPLYFLHPFVRIISELQEIHDFQEPDQWPHALNVLATRYNLINPEGD